MTKIIAILKKNIVMIVLIVLIIGLVVTQVKYTNLYTAHNDSKELQELNDQLLKVEEELKELIAKTKERSKEGDSKKDEDKPESELEDETVITKIERETTEIHIPSILVLLEQNAQYLDLVLTINYIPPEDEIRHRIPATILGDYENTRDYLDFLSRIDYIEIEEIILTASDMQDKILTNVMVVITN